MIFLSLNQIKLFINYLQRFGKMERREREKKHQRERKMLFCSPFSKRILSFKHSFSPHPRLKGIVRFAFCLSVHFFVSVFTFLFECSFLSVMMMIMTDKFITNFFPLFLVRYSYIQYIYIQHILNIFRC